MLDRWGKSLIVGWPEHHLLWLHAAAKLRGQELCCALDDIASMTGRKYAECERKMRVMVADEKRQAREFLETAIRKNWQSDSLSDGSRRAFISTPTRARKIATLPPSALAAITRAQMTGGTARRVKARAIEAAE